MWQSLPFRQPNDMESSITFPTVPPNSSVWCATRHDFPGIWFLTQNDAVCGARRTIWWNCPPYTHTHKGRPWGAWKLNAFFTQCLLPGATCSLRSRSLNSQCSGHALEPYSQRCYSVFILLCHWSWLDMDLIIWPIWLEKVGNYHCDISAIVMAVRHNQVPT